MGVSLVALLKSRVILSVQGSVSIFTHQKFSSVEIVVNTLFAIYKGSLSGTLEPMLVTDSLSEVN